MPSSSPARVPGAPIALLAPHFPPDLGGVAGACERLARELARRVPVEVLVPTNALAPGVVKAETEGFLTVVRFGGTGATGDQQRLFELLSRRGPYRLIHAVYPSRTGFVATYSARYLNIPCLLAARGNDLDRDAFRPEFQPGLLHALAEADAVVGVSRALVRQARALGARRHATWVPNSVDARRFQPVDVDPALAERLGLTGAGPVIGFVGEARLKKGLPTLLEAFRLLRQARPNSRLLVVGPVRAGDRPLLDLYLAQHPELAPAITLTGHVETEALAAHYALMDLHWHPSTHDGLPNAILEALACGKLTIGSAVGGIPDVLDPEELPGLLVPPRDPEALAAATVALLSDDATRRALEAKAREYVLATFSPVREVGSYMALYEQLTGKLIPEAR